MGLFPATEPDNHRQRHNPAVPSYALPLSGYQQEWPCQIAQRRILSHIGHVQPTCEVTETDGKFIPLTCGFGKKWGACILVRNSHLLWQEPHPAWSTLNIVTLNPSLSLTTIPAVAPLCCHYIYRARILADDQIVMEGVVLPSSRPTRYILTVCRAGQRGTVTHEMLPGEHADNIVQFEQLADGRIVSASLDGTLKIRPLGRSCEGTEQVITLSHTHAPITDMVLFSDARCVTSSRDHCLTIWDLSRPAQESLVATLTDTVRGFVELHRFTCNHFLSRSCPNVLLLWQLTDSGAICRARIDPNGPPQLTASNQRAGRQPAYDRQNQCQAGNRFRLKVLPGNVVLLRSGQGVRLSGRQELHSAANTIATAQKNNNSSAASGDIRVIPTTAVGPPPTCPSGNIGPVGLLPDGRLVYGSRDGSIRAYSLENPNGDNGVTLGNFFVSQEMMQERYASYPRSIKWMVVMSDGRLLAACERKSTMRDSPKTLFLVYDPYNESGSASAPIQASLASNLEALTAQTRSTDARRSGAPQPCSSPAYHTRSRARAIQKSAELPGQHSSQLDVQGSRTHVKRKRPARRNTTHSP